MVGEYASCEPFKKKEKKEKEREPSTALILLRAAEIGITLSDLDYLTVGMLLDIFEERAKDYEDVMENNDTEMATQEDFDNF